MKVVTLLENRSISKAYKYKHGLSLYIETSQHKILFDTGTDASFVYNADKLGVNLAEVDIVVISHGHYDHGGGLEAFLKINEQAKIYIGKGAFDKHLFKILGIIKHNIGLKDTLRTNSRLIFVDELVKIDDALIIFGSVKGKRLVPHGNDQLLKVNHSGLVEKDDFEHEISLVINENQKHTLFCGCGHKGILNIIERAKEIIQSDLNTVVGGFHLIDLNVQKATSKQFLDDLSSMLSSNAVEQYFTCHCTGEQPYNYLSQKMTHLDDLRTGKVIEV